MSAHISYAIFAKKRERRAAGVTAECGGGGGGESGDASLFRFSVTCYVCMTAICIYTHSLRLLTLVVLCT